MSVAISTLGIVVLMPVLVLAQNAEELEDKIADHAEKIKALEEEIRQYSQQLDVVGKEKQTLKSAIDTLDISRKKITTNIDLTENKISATDLTIKELGHEITLKELEIERGTVAVIEAIQALDAMENTSMIETLLANNTLATFWDDISILSQVRDSMRDQIAELSGAKEEFENAKGESEGEKTKLTELQDELSGEKKVLDENRAQKDSLLKETQNKESTYQQMLNERIAARKNFEAEMLAYEAQLDFILDRNTIPTSGSGALKWPFDAAYMSGFCANQTGLGNAFCITQFFGETDFANSAAGAIYKGKGHPGIDFRAAIGTKLVAPLSGTVIGVGDTDQYPGCYSWGKWVAIRHPNGLTSLFGHLSQITVSQGASVTTGDLIGYSGGTGYVTNPHLHFGVFASSGFTIQLLSSIPGRPITGCSAATIPVIPQTAYLNPLDYLK